MIKTYSKLITLPTFEERFKYLQNSSLIGKSTFGFDRYLNQAFYTSKEWRYIRNQVIVRDEGCDLGIIDRPIYDKVIVHHMNKITPEQLEKDISIALDPEYLITTHWLTHEAIHYSDITLLPKPFVDRQPDDTNPWKQKKEK